MWVIVINPISGSGKGATLGPIVTRYFASHGLEYTVVTAASAEKLRLKIIIELDQIAYCDGVVAVGGDGLVHLILQIVVPRKIAFAVIPAGTGNDYVRALGWPLDSVCEQLDVVTTTNPRSIDLGLVDSEWFAAILSTGFDAVVNERANTLVWPRGPMKYNAAIALELARFKPKIYQIELDNQSLQVEAMLIAVANGSSYGGGMLVCPAADMHDGLFDIMVLLPVSKFEFLKVFPKVFRGQHISHPQVRMYRSGSISLAADAIAYADGERIGALPISAHCVAGAGLSWSP